MPTDIFYNAETDDWNELMHRKCECGHDLYMHGFTDHNSSLGYPNKVLWVSQCVSRCNCEVFHQKEKYDRSTKV